MSSAREPESSRQVKQMVNFIMQEAQEKVSELKLKTDHDCQLEKQNLVHNGKNKVIEEYEQKKKDLEIQQRVFRSNAASAARVKKMKSRDDMLEVLKSEARTKLAQFVQGPEYPRLVKDLIVQGLIKIEEQTVEIQSRVEDRALVSRVLPDAITEYRQIMASAGHTKNPRVTLSENTLTPGVTGGVVLTALSNKIILNQTLDERLQIAYTDMMPSVRYGLFGR